MKKEIRRITAEELRKESYLLGFLNKNINKGGSGRIQRTLLESKVPLNLEEILEISANSAEGIALIEKSHQKGGRNPFDINNPTNRGIKVIEYFTNKKFFYKGYPAIGTNAEGKYYLTKLSDFPELSKAESLNSNKKLVKEIPNSEHLPTITDFERAYKKLTGLSQERKVKMDILFDEMEKDYKKKGIRLKNNWRSIFRKNMRL
jgi:hypothetical protein